MTKPAQQTLRCAIYTRVSTDHGLEQDFNSLHAQREADALVVGLRHGGRLGQRAPHDEPAGGRRTGAIDPLTLYGPAARCVASSSSPP